MHRRTKNDTSGLRHVSSDIDDFHENPEPDCAFVVTHDLALTDDLLGRCQGEPGVAEPMQCFRVRQQLVPTDYLAGAGAGAGLLNLWSHDNKQLRANTPGTHMATECGIHDVCICICTYTDTCVLFKEDASQITNLSSTCPQNPQGAHSNTYLHNNATKNMKT